MKVPQIKIDSPTTTASVDLAQIRQSPEVVSMLPIVQQANSVTVTDASSLALADSILNRLASARKAIDDRIECILKPMNQARNSILSLRRELDTPAAMAESVIREKMRQYRLQEILNEQVEQKRIADEKAELDRKARDLEEKERLAKTPQMQARLANQRLAVETQAAQKEMEKPAEPVKLSGSTFRPIQKAEVESVDALLEGIKTGSVPRLVLHNDDVQEAFNKVVRAYYKQAPGLVSAWPGVKIVDDVSIVRR